MTQIFGRFFKLNIFYNDIMLLAQTLKTLPASVDTFLYDPRFQDLVALDTMDRFGEDFFDEPDKYYRELMQEVYAMSFNEDVMTYICDSQDVNDSPDEGDFNYFTCFINNECPMIYHQSSHNFAYPSRIVLYGPTYQVEISSHLRKVDIYETVHSSRNMFYIDDKKKMISEIKKMLFNSDRPRLNTIKDF